MMKVVNYLLSGVVALLFIVLVLPTISYAATGEDWTLATDDAPWEARRTHESITFDDKLWVIGGYSDLNGGLNDVWYSEDGETWTEATASADWSGRRNFGTAVFDDKLWVIGGHDGALKNDVWYSEDGETWTEATSTAAWGARQAFGIVTFDDKLWILGGFTAGNVSVNDVWYSEDGIDWIEATSSAEWEPRYSHRAEVFEDKMWVLGYYEYYDEDLEDDFTKTDAWYSEDGVSWTNVTDDAGWIPRANFTSAVFDDKLWVIGGAEVGGDNLNDVWYSEDGETWTEATSTAAWEARLGLRSAVLDNKLWIMAGQTDIPDAEEIYERNDVWYTSLALYTLSFDEQGGSIVSDIENQGVGEDITLPAAPIRSGFTFVEWNTAADGSGTAYAAGASYTMPASNTTLYAIWQEAAEENTRRSGSSSTRTVSCTAERTSFCARSSRNTTPPESTEATVPDIPVRDLYYGTVGEDVRRLQTLLIAKGYQIPAGATSFFFGQTRAALAAYQAANSIVPAVGYFGPITRAQMKAAGLPGLWW